MPHLTTVEAGPVVVVGDLASTVLWGLNDILALELGSGNLQAKDLRLGLVLHRALGPGHLMAKAS